MRTQRFSIPGFVIFATIVVSIGSAHAQTTAVGPYYATPSWDQKLPASTRFVVLSNWNSEAVLDRETGLVWEKSPAVSFLPWVEAQSYCNRLSKGNRKGWRLPALQELASLADPTQSNPALPAGHPFSNVNMNLLYWSANTANSPFGTFSSAWGVFFSNGAVIHNDKTSPLVTWCVRGGQGGDPQ